MTPYILAGTLIIGLFIGGLVVAWYFLASCILKGGIQVEERTCKTCKFEGSESLMYPCYECLKSHEFYYDFNWEPK